MFEREAMNEEPSLPRDGAEWVARVHARPLKGFERRALDEWLAASTEHTRDYLRAETIWRLSGGLAEDPQMQGELARLRGEPYSRSTNAPSMRSRHRHWLAMAASLAIAITLGLLWAARNAGPVWYETAPGEQRLVTLADGSSIAINTASRVGVKYDAEQRSVRLERGEALFQVNKDPARPFVVRASGGYVRAVGTRFNVMMDPDSDAVTVSVLEGRVEVAGQSGTYLDAGESAAYQKSGHIVKADPEQASRERINAWREGKLSFDAWPLDRAIREHNRYAKKPIRIGSADLHDVRVSGVFRIGDTEALVAALNQLIDVKAVEREDALVLEPAPQ